MLNNIIDYVVSKLENTDIFEMAYERKDYKNTVRNLKDQIIENWCLIRYCTLTNLPLSKDHWKQELIAHLSNLYRMQLKVDKTKATREELLIYPENNNFENIIWIISEKWQQEKLDIESSETEQVAKDCAEYGIEEMIDIISNNREKTFNHIKEYVNNI